MPSRIDNPPNPWLEAHVEYDGEVPLARLEIFEEHAKSAIQRNQSPDIDYDYGVNPYRGCYHGCAYCYARRSHEFLGFGAGTDFERKLVVKPNIAEVLRKELNAKSWRGDRVIFSGNTDCYQPIEAATRLTRACLEVCLEFKNPVGIITKGALIRRDLDLLTALHREADCRVAISIPFLDDDLRRSMEPYASPIDRRFDALAEIAGRGIPTIVMVAPLIPGLNDSELVPVLERAKRAGAQTAAMTLLRLPGPVLPVFDVALERLGPARKRKVRHAIQESRGGKMNDSAFGSRFEGQGPRLAAVRQLFEQTKKRLGLDTTLPVTPSTFVRPTRQLGLEF